MFREHNMVDLGGKKTTLRHCIFAKIAPSFYEKISSRL